MHRRWRFQQLCPLIRQTRSRKERCLLSFLVESAVLGEQAPLTMWSLTSASCDICITNIQTLGGGTNTEELSTLHEKRYDGNKSPDEQNNDDKSPEKFGCFDRIESLGPSDRPKFNFNEALTDSSSSDLTSISRKSSVMQTTEHQRNVNILYPSIYGHTETYRRRVSNVFRCSSSFSI